MLQLDGTIKSNNYLLGVAQLSGDATNCDGWFLCEKKANVIGITSAKGSHIEKIIG